MHALFYVNVKDNHPAGYSYINWAVIYLRELQSSIIHEHLCTVCGKLGYIRVRLLIFRHPVNWLVFLRIGGILPPHFWCCGRVKVNLFEQEVCQKFQNTTRLNEPSSENQFLIPISDFFGRRKFLS